MTQEKLNNIIRTESPILDSIKLFIFDEVHNISLGSRGWIYEETISLLLQDTRTSSAKMIFISAIMPNHFAIKEWVDPVEMNDTVTTTWQPTRQLKGIISQPIDWKIGRETGFVQCYGNLYYARNKHDSQFPIRINNLVKTKSFKYERSIDKFILINNNWQPEFLYNLTKKFLNFGQVMVYFPKNSDAHKFCKSYISFLGQQEQVNETLVQDLLDSQVPENHPILHFVKHKIAYHDGTLSLEARNDIERGFKNGLIEVLATSKTLLQGVNIPAKTFIISDYGVRRYTKSERWVTQVSHPIDKKDFKNLLGRVGRAGYDTEGQIIFCQCDGEDNWRNYLFTAEDDNELEITSALSEKSIQESLSNLCSAVDEGTLEVESVINDDIIDSYSKDKENLLRKLQAYALMKSANTVFSHEDSIEESIEKDIQQFTLIGQTELARYNISKFISYSVIAIRSKVSSEVQSVLKKTGLSYQSAFKLYRFAVEFWHETTQATHLLEINAEFVNRIGDAIFELKEIKPTVRAGASRYCSPLLSEWIFKSHTSYADNEQFIKNFNKYIVPASATIERKAEVFSDFRSNILSYKAPWGLSAFYTISEYVLRIRNIDIKILPLNDTFSCLPAFAKFGVSKPAAALFCSLGLKSAFTSNKLATLYESFFGRTAINYNHMLKWFLGIHDNDGTEISLRQLEAEYEFTSKEVKKLRDAQKELEVWDGPISSDNLSREIVISEGTFLTDWKYLGTDLILNLIQEGDICNIEIDRSNTYDPEAVKVRFQDFTIGFIPSIYSRPLLDHINNGDKITVTIINKYHSDNNHKPIKVRIIAESVSYP